MLHNILAGLQEIFSLDAMIFMAIGCIVGLIIGALPGLTANMAVALCVPLTFVMRPSVGLAFLVAIYCSSIYGGSISAILIGIPGTISSFATTIDGYPMSKKGQAGLALGVATISSVIGGLFSAVVLMFFTPPLAEQALRFGPAEYFAVAVLGLSCLSSIGGNNLKKGLLSGMLGLMISCIGMDPQTGYQRFTFGSFELMEGIGLVPALMGFFGIVAIMKNAEKAEKAVQVNKIPDVGSCWIGLKNCKYLIPTWIRGSIIGTLVGIMPGAGTNIATFLAYDTEKKTAKDKRMFGKGDMRGVAAPESANNGVTGGSMVPLLALGIPGNATSALFLGAIMIHGMQTGPAFFSEKPEVAYSLFIAFLLANILMAPIGLFLVRYMKGVLAVPEGLLGGIILAFCATGIYALSNSMFDVLIMIIFGILGYLFYKVKLPTAPLIVAMVLGALTERNLWQAFLLEDHSIRFLWTRPITLVLMIISLFSFFAPMVSKAIKERRKRLAIESVADLTTGEEEED